MDAELKQAQINNVKAVTENTVARTATEVVRESKYLTDTQKKQLELKVAQELAPTEIQTGKAQLQYLREKIGGQQLENINKDIKSDILRAEKRWKETGIKPADIIMIKGAIEIMNMFNMDTRWLEQIIRNVTGKSINEFLLK